MVPDGSSRTEHPMQDPSHPGAPHKFHAADAERLLDPRRRTDVDPVVLLEAMALGAGDRVGDIGCGNGFWLEQLLDLAPEGVRFEAMDVSLEMLRALEERLSRHRRWRDVTLHLSGESRLPLPDGSLRAALLVNVFHELDDRKAFLHEVRRVLAPGGRLVLVDWDRPSGVALSDRGPPLDHRVPRATALQEMREVGFEDIRELPTAVDFHGLVGRRTAP